MAKKILATSFRMCDSEAAAVKRLADRWGSSMSDVLHRLIAGGLMSIMEGKEGVVATLNRERVAKQFMESQ